MKSRHARYSLQNFLYATYAQYFVELAKLDSGFKDLKQFFNGPLSKPPVHVHSTAPSHGSIRIYDVANDRLKLSQWIVPAKGLAKQDRQSIYRKLDDRPAAAQARIVFVDYEHDEDKDSNKFTGFDVSVLDRFALRYRLHPEILRMHFAWTSKEESNCYEVLLQKLKDLYVSLSWSLIYCLTQTGGFFQSDNH